MPTVSAAGRCCCGPRVAVISSSPREIRAQPDLAAFAAGEITPGPACRSDAEIDAHIRATAITVHHPLGTCKMGRANDPTAVVDPELRVLGVDALRGGDASVMPGRSGG